MWFGYKLIRCRFKLNSKQIDVEPNTWSVNPVRKVGFIEKPEGEGCWDREGSFGYISVTEYHSQVSFVSCVIRGNIPRPLSIIRFV